LDEAIPTNDKEIDRKKVAGLYRRAADLLDNHGEYKEAYFLRYEAEMLDPIEVPVVPGQLCWWRYPKGVWGLGVVAHNRYGVYTQNGYLSFRSIEWELYEFKTAEIADTFDPPNPEPGKFVWWRDYEGLCDWSTAIYAGADYLLAVSGTTAKWIAIDSVDWKLAQIPAPGEVAVPLEELADVRRDISEGRYRAVSEWVKYYLERAEAERKEAKR